jgi:radical SAM protein with 4Fe4S-binding SPASM domain
MISYCIVSDNIKDIKDNIVNFIDSLQIKDIQLGVSIARKIGRWKENCRGCRDYSLGEAYKILENTLLQIYEKGWDSPAFYRNFIKRNCTFGQRFAVDSNGDVFPCAETVYKIGNVRNESIRDISARLKEVHQLSDVEHTETCRLCDIKYICRGGCKTLRAQNYNTPFRQECSSETRDLIYQKMADETII